MRGSNLREARLTRKSKRAKQLPLTPGTPITCQQCIRKVVARFLNLDHALDGTK